MLQQLFRDPALLADLEKFARRKTIAQDEVMIRPGDPIVFVPLVEQGVLRIMREDEQGRDVFLYHLFPGQTCAMAINCCQAGKTSMVKAIAEDTTTLIQLPARQLEEWMKYAEWRAYINQTYSNRFGELLQVIDLIAFSHMDEQLLHYLQQRAKALQTTVLVITHQQIADEMHSHREAISRLLRQMEQKDLVKLGRNTIELLQL